MRVYLVTFVLNAGACMQQPAMALSDVATSFDRTRTVSLSLVFVFGASFFYFRASYE